MVWDSDKNTGDELTSDEWDTHVSEGHQVGGTTITNLAGQGLERVGNALQVLSSIWDGTNIVADVDNASVTTEEVNNNNYVEPQATASASTTYNADLSTANYHKVTLTGDVTFDFTNADASDVNSLVLHLVQDATGGRTPSFTPTVVWDGGTAPSWSTAANAEDIVTFVHDQDGGQWVGFVGGLTLG